ncbi:MAG: metallophosphoesterase [Anaerolineae bacterium]|jgi:predicted MPP superfamily phosphohydrolase
MGLTKDDPAGYYARPLHIALLLTEQLGRVHPLILTPIWLGLAAVAGLPWARAGLSLAAALVAFGVNVADGLSLTLLPRLGRSFGPVTPPLLGLAVVRTALTALTGLLWPTLAGLLAISALQLAIFAVAFYATWIEPFRIGVTRAELRSPKLAGSPPLRLLHISDLHVERISPRDRDLLRLVEELAPDLVVLTGDYLNLSAVYDSHAHAEARDLLARLCEIAPVPIYAITGSPPVDRAEIVPAIFDGLPITWLLDEIAQAHVNGHTLRIAGLRCTRERQLDGPRLRELLESAPDGAFTLLLYHSPDLMPEAAALGIDLYLCGHTHGGQIRLPLFGAVITSSDHWKRYEMGRYEEGGTTLYVSRGLGMEGKGAPRARFLAPPEIILWTLSYPTNASRV